MIMSTRVKVKARRQPNKALSVNALYRPSKFRLERLPHGVVLSATRLTLPENLDLDQWKAIGIKLCIIDSAMQWAIGDWWRYGHHAYGKRKAFAVANQLPYQFGTLMNLGWVARSVETSCRNEVRSFSHHAAVATLEPEDQKKWLTKAEKGQWSVSKLRDYIHEAAERALFDCPGFDAASEAESWLFNFLARARRAERACRWPHGLEPSYLDCVGDSSVAELVEAASNAAEAWREFTASLEEYRASERQSHNRTGTRAISPA
jgi:hypothetical protein